MRRLSDPTLFWLAVVATVVGLVAIWDAAIGNTSVAFPRELKVQGAIALLCVSATWVLARMRKDIPRVLAWPIFLLSIGALIALLMPGIGVEINGARRWIALPGGLTVQPSEFAKFAFVLLAAGILALKWPAPETTPQTRHWAEWLDKIGLPALVRWSPFLLALFAVLLIEQQPDLATGAVIVVVAFVMLFAAGAKFRFVALAGGVLCVLAFAAVVAQPYRLERFKAHAQRWEKDVRKDAGFQTTHSEAAMARGGLFGEGIGKGRAKDSMPTATSDFVLTTIAEEFGLIGSGLVLALLGAISWRMFALSLRADDRFSKLFLVGAAAWIATQTVANFVMANGTLPPMGIPLPFISYGGSSLLAIWLTVGVSLSVAAPAGEVKEHARSRRNRRWNRRARVSSA